MNVYGVSFLSSLFTGNAGCWLTITSSKRNNYINNWNVFSRTPIVLQYHEYSSSVCIRIMLLITWYKCKRIESESKRLGKYIKVMNDIRFCLTLQFHYRFCTTICISNTMGILFFPIVTFMYWIKHNRFFSYIKNTMGVTNWSMSCLPVKATEMTPKR